MAINWVILGSIISPVFAVIVGAILERKLSRKAKLISYISHTSAIKTKMPNGTDLHVNTHSVVIQNSGNKPANNIRVGHHILPAFSIYPSIEYSIIDLPDGKKEINIPILVPKERITINYLYFPPITWQNINATTKSDNGFVKIVKMQLQQKASKTAVIIVGIFTIIGIIATLYAIINIVKYIITKI